MFTMVFAMGCLLGFDDQGPPRIDSAIDTEIS
jgi:hypothetical protein